MWKFSTKDYAEAAVDSVRAYSPAVSNGIEQNLIGLFKQLAVTALMSYPPKTKVTIEASGGSESRIRAIELEDTDKEGKPILRKVEKEDIVNTLSISIQEG